VARGLKDRYIVGLLALAFFVSSVAAALAVVGNTHTTNGVGHGVSNFPSRPHLRAASLDRSAGNPGFHRRNAPLLLGRDVQRAVFQRGLRLHRVRR
jgi:hypothetical protein